VIVALPAPDDSAIAPRRLFTFRGRVARAGDTPASSGNVANIITVIRILLVPVFVWLLFLDTAHGLAQNGPIRYIAAALFILAIATDGVDGHLARGRNLVTNIGIILDPIADKLLTGAALVSLSILSELPWWVTAIIVVREVGITVFRFIVIRKRVIPASKGGKLKTLAQSVAISLALLPFHALFSTTSTVLGPQTNWVDFVNLTFMVIAFVLTVYSGIDYFVQYSRANRPARAGVPSA
jgi:CDP-diacylglycerol--glycerol-3-phosphate 3-phosphatidyltransferase